MRRAFLVILVLISVLWQSLALAGGRVSLEGGDPEHAALHWQEESHHHHDDGSWHLDVSADSIAHLQLDSALSAPALLGETPTALAQAASGAPESLLQLHLPMPPPQAPRRPPRLNA